MLEFDKKYSKIVCENILGVISIGTVYSRKTEKVGEGWKREERGNLMF